MFGFARKVQKSLADLEKLHVSGQGINLFLPTGVGHKHEDKVWFLQVQDNKQELEYTILVPFGIVSGVKESDFR